ncbi:unnamed protein product [Sphagnum jensenii]|uniref:Uncharacterized protein n=1 Tax=Sphagnum jensenii TaxID=128206 RepID=A0ABP0VAB6_9BRYO
MNASENDLLLFESDSASHSQETGPINSNCNSHNNILASQNTSTISLPVKSLIKYIQHDPSSDSKHSHWSNDLDFPSDSPSNNAQNVNNLVNDTDGICQDGSNSNITIQITPIFSQMSQKSQNSMTSLNNILFPGATHDNVHTSSAKGSKRSKQALNIQVGGSLDNSVRPTMSLASPVRSSVTAAGTSLLTSVNSPFSPHSYTTAHIEQGASPYRASYNTNNTLNTSNTNNTNNTLNTSNNSSLDNYEDIRAANGEAEMNGSGGYQKTAAAADVTSPATPTHHVLAKKDCDMIESLLLSPEPKTNYYLANNGEVYNSTSSCIQNYIHNNSSNHINGYDHHYESSSDNSNVVLSLSKRKSNLSKLFLDVEIDTSDSAASASNTHHLNDHISHSISLNHENSSVVSGSGSAREGLRSSGSMTSMNNGSSGDLDVLSQFAEVCEDR